MLKRAVCDLQKKVYVTTIPDQFHMEISSNKLFNMSHQALLLSNKIRFIEKQGKKGSGVNFRKLLIWFIILKASGRFRKAFTIKN